MLLQSSDFFSPHMISRHCLQHVRGLPVFVEVDENRCRGEGVVVACSCCQSAVVRNSLCELQDTREEQVNKFGEFY
jgi:hypothetical protein